MSLQVWLPLNKDPNMTPEIASYRKESGVTLTEDTDGWYKVHDTTHGANGRWGIYYDFAVKPNTTYTLYVYSKSTTGTKASIGIQSFAVIAWPAVRDTNTTSDEKLTTYSWTTSPSDSIARVYLALMTTSTKNNDYVFYKEPMVYEVPQNQGIDTINFSTNTGATFVTNGKIGGCYSFDASNDWIQGIFDKTKYSEKPLTLACWFKSDQIDSGGIIVDLAADLCLGYNYNTNGIQFRFWRCYKNSSGNRTGVSGVTNTYYNADNWHHIIIIFNNGIEKIYIDGQLSQTFDHSNLYGYWEPLLGASYNRISIGKSAGDSNWIGGMVNDVRIYDYALSECEVKELAHGLVLHYPLDNNGLGNENLATCGSTSVFNIAAGTGKYNYAWLAVTGTLTVGETYTVSAEVEVSDNINKCTIYNYHTNPTTGGPINNDFPADGKRHSWTFVATATGLLGYTGVAGAADNKSAVYKNIKIEQGNQATAYIPRTNESLYTKMGMNNNIVYDISGFNNNGTVTGALSTSSDTVRYKVSTYFSGSSYISREPLHSEVKSFSFWLKCANASTTQQIVFIDYGTKLAFGFYNGYIITSYTATAITGNKVLIGDSWIDDDWNHIVVIKNNNAISTYCNGTLMTASGNDYWSYNADEYFMIGRRPHGDRQLLGYISDFRAYATALSATDIAELYEMGREVV